MDEPSWPEVVEEVFLPGTATIIMKGPIMHKRLTGALCAGLLLHGLVTTANAALLGRLPATPGGTDYQAYYDEQLNITWAADPNIKATMNNWSTANAWAAGLTIGGVSGWRLPSADVNGDTTVVNCSPGGVAGCADNEMGFLFWEEGITAGAPSPFSNVQAFVYWSGTEWALDNSDAWYFTFNNGSQTAGSKSLTGLFAWAVRSGDVAR
jgi:hypothetical protein